MNNIYQVVIIGLNSVYLIEFNPSNNKHQTNNFVFENKNKSIINSLNQVTLDSKIELFVYIANNNYLNLSVFTRTQNNKNLLIDTQKEFNYNQIAKKLLCLNDRFFIVVLEKQSDSLNLSIMICEKNGLYDDLYILEERITRINSIKIFEVQSF